MSNIEQEKEKEKKYGSAALVVLLIAVWLIAVLSMAWCYQLQAHVQRNDEELLESRRDNAAQRAHLADADARLRAATETLAQGVGITQKQLELKSRELTARQAEQKIDADRLEHAQLVARLQLGRVTSDIGDVRSDIGDVKTDVAATRTEVEDAKAQLQRSMGDAGVMSGLIARNHQEVEVLRQRGRRNYFEFTLKRNGPAEQVSDVQLRLKRTDDKGSRYTLLVIADDRSIEKRDKSLMEPVQFYSGADKALYEIVVNTMSKDRISGYLSTPKSTPTVE